MRAERLGSYSMAATFAGIPVLSRRKSIERYRFWWPPPRCHIVTSPCELRPPVRFLLSVNDFSGVSFVISLLSSIVRKRRDGVYGLNVFSAIFASCYPKRLPFLCCFAGSTGSRRTRSSFRQARASHTPSSNRFENLLHGRDD